MSLWPLSVPCSLCPLFIVASRSGLGVAARCLWSLSLTYLSCLFPWSLSRASLFLVPCWPNSLNTLCRISCCDLFPLWDISLQSVSGLSLWPVSLASLSGLALWPHFQGVTSGLSVASFSGMSLWFLSGHSLWHLSDLSLSALFICTQSLASLQNLYLSGISVTRLLLTQKINW